MIASRKDLHEYIRADHSRYEGGIPNIKDWLLHNEKWFAYRLVTELRYVEYYKNTKKRLIGNLLYAWHMLLYKRLCWKCKCIINPNTCGPGLIIEHLGSTIYIRKGSIIGRNLTIIGGGLLGKQKDDGIEKIIIGNNCFIGINSTILGNVKIGDNVTIGAHALVTKDVPNNSVVVGVNKILRKKYD